MLVLRILNGPLFGTEVVVPSGGYFVRMVDPAMPSGDISIEEGIDRWANGAVLTIPLVGGSPNFRLIPLVYESGAVSLRIETYGIDTGITEKVEPLNVTLSVGRLQIAVRAAHEGWSSDVAMYRGEHPLVETPGAPQLSLPIRPAWHRLAGVCSTFVGAAGLATLVWLTWPAPAPAADVKSLLGDQSYQVVEGGDRRIYVLVRHADNVAPVKRQLARAGVNHVRIRIRAQEAARIGRWLESTGIPYFSVDLNDIRHPVLRLRRAVGSSRVVPVDFNAQLRKIAPYARDITVQWRSEDEAQRAARFLVEGVGARATFRVTPGHFVAAVDDYLSDAQLDAFSRALAAYHRAWGKQYTQFEINQRDLTHIDGLKTGRFNYELRSARHIYFPPT